MAGYIGSKASVVSSGAERKKTFAITGTTTVLTGLSYTPTFVHLFHNGVRLVDGTDYTATNGTSITLTSAAESGDEVVVISYASFQVADAYTKAEADAEFVSVSGDTMTGSLTVAGVASGGLNTFVNPSGANYNENLRLPRSDNGFVSISMGSDPAASSGALSNQWTQVVYPSDHPTLSDYFAIRKGDVTLDALRIDTGGRVTTPYQPAFWAFNNGGVSQGATGFVNFSAALANTGNHYSTTTSRFTAPVAGAYCFDGMLLFRSNNVAGSSEWSFTVNGTNVSGRGMAYATAQYPSGHIPASSQLIVGLNAGDYVQMYIHYIAANTDYYTGEKLAHFSGYLIG